jgi:hypothetical protein
MIVCIGAANLAIVPLHYPRFLSTRRRIANRTDHIGNELTSYTFLFIDRQAAGVSRQGRAVTCSAELNWPATTLSKIYIAGVARNASW